MTTSTENSVTENCESPMHLTVPIESAGQRLDKVLAELFPQYSRNRLQDWLKQGLITLNGENVMSKYKVQGEEILRIALPDEPLDENIEGENIPLNVLYKDSDLIVVNKSADMVVHPAAGNRQGTMQNALLYHFPDLALVPRAGIVHRLDKETSGLLVIARTLVAHKQLVNALQKREITREYFTIVHGMVIAGATIEAPIGRHPVDRKRMAVKQGGRDSVTHYRTAQHFRAHTALHVFLETGRTHQIRVHMAHIKRPVLGDPTYGGRLRIPKDSSPEFSAALHGFKRQALHAARLSFTHPKTGEEMEWKAEMPEDMKVLLKALTDDVRAHDK